MIHKLILILIFHEILTLVLQFQGRIRARARALVGAMKCKVSAGALLKYYSNSSGSPHTMPCISLSLVLKLSYNLYRRSFGQGEEVEVLCIHLCQKQYMHVTKREVKVGKVKCTTRWRLVISDYNSISVSLCAKDGYISFSCIIY